MKNHELIQKLKQFPSDVEVWNFNEGMPTPISDVLVFDEGSKDRGNIILSSTARAVVL